MLALLVCCSDSCFIIELWRINEEADEEEGTSCVIWFRSELLLLLAVAGFEPDDADDEADDEGAWFEPGLSVACCCSPAISCCIALVSLPLFWWP